MSDKKQRVWAYLDGRLTEDERTDFERQLKGDAELNRLFAEAKTLDHSLQEEELDQPSLRFTTNLMEQLPDMYRSISVKPLFSEKALRIMLVSIAFLVIVNLGIGLVVDPSATEQLPGLNATQKLVEEIPANWILMIVALSIGYLGYVLLDRWLAKRFLDS